MSSLYLTEQGAYVYREKGSVVVKKKGEVITRIHEGDLDEIVVVGNIVLAPSLIRFAFSRRIAVTFLTYRGNYVGRLATRPMGDVNLRLAQYRAMESPGLRLDVAQAIVVRKLQAQRRLLRSRNYRLHDDVISEAVMDLGAFAEKAAKTKDHEELMGIEGAAARVYFAGFARCLKSGTLRFGGRTRRPPLDEVNAMLSFGYTLLSNVVEAAVMRTSLDPMLGFLHATQYGRPSLVLDLMEPLRAPAVDSLVLRLVNTRTFTADDFTRPEETVSEVWRFSEEDVAGLVKPTEHEARDTDGEYNGPGGDGRDGKDAKGVEGAREGLLGRDTPVYFERESLRVFISSFEQHTRRKRIYDPAVPPADLRNTALSMARHLAGALKQGKVPFGRDEEGRETGTGAPGEDGKQ